MKRSLSSQKDINIFFGYNNTVNRLKGFINYKSILSNDKIIVRTDNVRPVYVKDRNGYDTAAWILVIGNNEYINLQYWQVKRVFYIEDEKTKSTYLVKLDRNYFHVKKQSEPFENVSFKTTDSFESLYEHARLQELAQTKIRL